MNKPPRWFYVVAFIALLWNLLGCVAFIGDLRLTAADIAQMPAEHQALYAARPAWAVAGTALGVFGGVLGCIALLLRKKWALPVFVLSLIGIIVQDIGLFVLADAIKLAGPVVAVLQGMVLVVAIGLVGLSRRGIQRSWLS